MVKTIIPENYHHPVVVFVKNYRFDGRSDTSRHTGDETARRGRLYLTEYERSEILCLVTGDQEIVNKAPLRGFVYTL